MSRDTNPCPAPGCAARIPTHLWACRRHWFELPAELRSSIWSAYRSGRVMEHLDEHVTRSADVWGGVG